jgi:hypothetical protein
VATFTHAGGVEPAGAFTATINWGDGTTSAGTITLSGTTYIVTGSHTYTGGNKHTISTTVKEAGNSPVSEAGSKIDDERPGTGSWRDQDVVHLPMGFGDGRASAAQPAAPVVTDPRPAGAPAPAAPAIPSGQQGGAPSDPVDATRGGARVVDPFASLGVEGLQPDPLRRKRPRPSDDWSPDPGA